MSPPDSQIPTPEQLAKVVALQIGIRDVDINADLVEDLGLSSVDLVSILATIEDRWGIALDERIFAETTTVTALAQQVIAAANPVPP